MNLQRVWGRLGQRLQCVLCFRMRDVDMIEADLDARAGTFICLHCRDRYIRFTMSRDPRVQAVFGREVL